MDDLRLDPEQEAQLIKFIDGQPFGTIVRCDDAPLTRTMLCTEKYIGTRISAVRKQIDQLDQVTVWWNPSSDAHKKRFLDY